MAQACLQPTEMAVNEVTAAGKSTGTGVGLLV
jgi:hypothetical protein